MILGKLEVTLLPPRYGKNLQYCSAFTDEMWADIFAPLPRDRELAWAPKSRDQAREQIKLRQEWTKRLGLKIADSILKCIESQDPHFGYSPEEWKRINNE